MRSRMERYEMLRTTMAAFPRCEFDEVQLGDEATGCRPSGTLVAFSDLGFEVGRLLCCLTGATGRV